MPWGSWAAWVALAGRVGAPTPWAFRDAGRAMGSWAKDGRCHFKTGLSAAESGANVAGITAPEKLHVAPANGRPPVARASESRGNAPRT